MVFKSDAITDSSGKTVFLPKAKLHPTDHAFFQEMMANAEMFVVTDPRLPDHPIVYASPNFLEFTGYSAEEIVGKNCRFLQGVDTEAEDIGEISQAIKERRDCTVGLVNYKKDGQVFYNEFFMTTLARKVPFLGHRSKTPTYFIGIQTPADEVSYKKVENNKGKHAREDNVAFAEGA